MGAKKILIIDDEKAICQLVKDGLERMGDFEVIMALSGLIGIELAKKIRPDLILLDIGMPRMSGFEVIRKLKEDNDTITIPVVMLSGRGDEEAKIESMELYDEDYITKPIALTDLKVKIESVLKRRVPDKTGWGKV